MARYVIMGIEDSDGDPCECCGTPCPKRRVVLRDISSGEDRRYGSTCAAYAMLGSRGRKSAQALNRNAEIVQYARKWHAAGRSLEIVARGIWNRFGRQLTVRPNGIEVVGVGLIELAEVA